MSKCKACFSNVDRRFKVMQRPTAGVCPVCKPQDVISPAEDACVCPPIGEPNKLTLLAPVVFDECGINICKTIDLGDLLDDKHDCNDDILRFININDCGDIRCDTRALQVQVLDINFNIDEDTVQTLVRRPNCVRVRLEDITIKFLIKFLDENCNVLAEAILISPYLPSDEEDDDFDDETNRPFAIDLYAPYGVHYSKEDSMIVDDIQFIGFLKDNNALRQGIVSQALAKVVAFDPTSFIVALGVTLYLKVVYFVQYKVPHAGLCSHRARKKS